MSYAATVLNVMIASPGDVAAERRLAKDVIDEWNAVNAAHRKLVLMPVGWESHASPEMGERPQGIVSKQILSDCDLLIAIFWTRIGSPTGKAVSGTIEEIEEHLALGKPAMLYFSVAPVRLDSVDNEQFAALKTFKDEFKKRGLVEEYESLTSFREKLSRHLAQTVNRKFSTSNVAEQDVSQAAPLPALSAEATELLVEASKDAGGRILSVGTLSGMILQANGRNFITSNDNRTIAKWRQAVSDLVDHGLIEDRGFKGEVFSVTVLGYQVADRMGAR